MSITVVNGKDGRRYVWPETGEAYPSVTTILKNLESPFSRAAVHNVATYAVDHVLEWEKLPRGTAISKIKESQWGKADFGSEVHRVVQEWLDEPTLEIENVEPDYLLYLKAAINWLNANVQKAIHVEKVVFNTEYQYAGSADAIVKLRSGELAVVDWKTGGIYHRYALQQVAYARADYVIVDDSPVRLPPISKAFIVQLTEEGEYQDYEVDLSPRAFRTFCALRTLQKWKDDHAADALVKISSKTEEKTAAEQT